MDVFPLRGTPGGKGRGLGTYRGHTLRHRVGEGPKVYGGRNRTDCDLRGSFRPSRDVGKDDPIPTLTPTRPSSWVARGPSLDTGKGGSRVRGNYGHFGNL